MKDDCNAYESCKTETSGDCCDMTEKFFAIADEAWYELLKEKIKISIEKSCGAQMDKLANLVADANNEKWALIMQGKVKCEEFQKNLKAIFAEK